MATHSRIPPIPQTELELENVPHNGQSLRSRDETFRDDASHLRERISAVSL